MGKRAMVDKSCDDTSKRRRTTTADAGVTPSIPDMCVYRLVYFTNNAHVLMYETYRSSHEKDSDEKDCDDLAESSASVANEKHVSTVASTASSAAATTTVPTAPPTGSGSSDAVDLAVFNRQGSQGDNVG